VDLAIIAQVVSAIGTVGLTVLFGFQLRVFYRQVLVNRDTLNEMREARVSTNALRWWSPPSTATAPRRGRHLQHRQG
jgi:hypothetical protein